jgi:hypothetical protein
MGCKLPATWWAAFPASLLAAAVFSTPVQAQECSPADIELSSQAEVDSFQDSHGPCHRATNLTIRGPDIVNLDGLADFTEVSGRLSIYGNSQLTNIDGFPALVSVGKLDILSNDVLVAIDGLNALAVIDSYLLIRLNYKLTSIQGLTSLRSVGENLFISNSWELADMRGLSAVTDLGGDLIIADTKLDNLDALSQLTRVGGTVNIQRNGYLYDCSGITRLIDGNDDGEPGPGPGIAGVPDVGDDVFLERNGAGCNSVRQILLGIDRFTINPGLNDAWFSPENTGQGFLVTLLPDARTIFLAWFTFDTGRPPEGTTAQLGDAGHRWLTAQGPYDPNQPEVWLDVFLTQGGLFDRAEPAPETGEPIGYMRIWWDECENAWLSYNLSGLGLNGSMAIRRIVPDNVALCEALSTVD